jgi:hypothetical protein
MRWQPSQPSITARSLNVGERLSRERAEAMDKKESLKLYVLGTMLVTLGLKKFQLSESGVWRPDGSLVRVPGRVCSGLVKQSVYRIFEVAAQARPPELPLIEIPVTVYLQEHYLRRDFRK